MGVAASEDNVAREAVVYTQSGAQRIIRAVHPVEIRARESASGCEHQIAQERVAEFCRKPPRNGA